MRLPPLPVPTSRVVDLSAAGLDDRFLRRATAAGRLVRVSRGTYVDADRWRALTRRERYVARIHAIVSALVGLCAVSHWSAAAVWGLPVPDDWPEQVEVVDCARGRGHSTPTLRRRPGPLTADEVVPWEGVWVTSAARTAADIALTNPFDHAVTVLDDGLRRGLFTKEEVTAALARRPGALRARSAAQAVEFATGAAQFAGESFSRCSMLAQGVQAPTLQQPFHEGGRLLAVVDFWWADVGVVGEFDGDWKYSDERWLDGRTAGQAVADEKRRQNRLDRHPRVERVVRWDYAVARDPDELSRRLFAVGVPRADASDRRRHHTAEGRRGRREAFG